MHIGSYSYDDFIQLVKSFHGNVAPGVVIGGNYPAPLVQHDQARARTLARYAVVKGPGT